MQVVQLWRYPVKSLGGEPLRSTRFEVGGIPFDRGMAVMDSDPARAGKPLTGRRQHRLLGYSASVQGDEVYVRSPLGKGYTDGDDSWLRELEVEFGQPATLLRSETSIHDAADVLVLNAASLRVLTTEYGSFVNPIRFRPNVIVDGTNAQPFEELAWPGNEISVGGAIVQVTHPCERCVLTTVDPESLEQDPGFLKLIVQEHAGRFGVYCTVVRAGDVRIGDEWSVRRASEVRV